MFLKVFKEGFHQKFTLKVCCLSFIPESLRYVILASQTQKIVQHYINELNFSFHNKMRFVDPLFNNAETA